MDRLLLYPLCSSYALLPRDDRFAAAAVLGVVAEEIGCAASGPVVATRDLAEQERST